MRGQVNLEASDKARGFPLRSRAPGREQKRYLALDVPRTALRPAI